MAYFNEGFAESISLNLKFYLKHTEFQLNER